jgi:hypothetical protein
MPKKRARVKAKRKIAPKKRQSPPKKKRSTKKPFELPPTKANVSRPKVFAVSRQVFIRRKKLTAKFKKSVPYNPETRKAVASHLDKVSDKFYAAHVDKKTARRVNVRAVVKITAKRGNWLASKPKRRKDKTWTNRVASSKKKSKGAKKEIFLNLATRAPLSKKPGALKKQVKKLMERLEAILARYEARGTIGKISFEGFTFDAVQSEEKVKVTGKRESTTPKKSRKT